MEELLNKFFSVKDERSLVPSRETGFPEELHKMAKDLIKKNHQEYKILQIYDIIILNLEKDKHIEDIMSGFYNLAKYPLCLFLDLDRPEFHQIRTFSGYYTYEIKEKLAGFEPIVEAFGYKLEGQMYKLDPEKKKDPNFLENLAIISCELLLAYEELSSFNETRKIAPNIEPKAHFITQKQTKDFRNHPEIPNPYPPVQKLPNIPTNLASNTGQPPFSPNPGHPSGTRGAEPRAVEPYHDQYNLNNPPYNNPHQPNYPGFDHPNYHRTPDFNQTGAPNVPPKPGRFDPNPITAAVQGPDRPNPSSEPDYNATINSQKKDHFNHNASNKPYNNPNQPGMTGQNAPTPEVNLDAYSADRNNERNTGNYSSPNYTRERNPYQLPPNSGSSDRNAANYPLDYNRDPNAFQFPPNSGSSDHNASNYSSPDYTRERNPSQLPPNSGLSDRNAGNYYPPDYTRERNASELPPNSGLSDRNAGNYQPKPGYPDEFRGTSEKPMQKVPSYEGMNAYENRRDENPGYRDIQHQYHEPPPNLQHSMSREVSGPPARPSGLGTSIRDGTVDEYSNTPSSSTSIHDPTSNTPYSCSSQVDRDGTRDGVEQLATSKTAGSYDSGAPKIPKPGESGSMGGVPSFSQHEKLGIHSQTPRGSPSGSTGQNQARTSQGLPPIEEGNQGRKYNQPQQTQVDPQSSASMGENKGKPMIPPPTKLDDKFQASAFTQGASQGLHEPQPSIHSRRHPDSGKQMGENLYTNKDEITKNEQNRAQATQGYPPGDMGQRNMDYVLENQHYVDQRGQYHQGGMNRDQYSGPQQTPMNQHHTGDISQTGGSRGFDKGLQEKGPYYEQGNTDRAGQYSGPQQTPMSQHHTGDIGQTGGSRGFDKGLQEKGPYYEQGNTDRAGQYSGPQQTPMSQHHTGDIGQTGGRRGFDKGLQEKGPYYEQGNTGRTGQYSGPQQTPMSQHHTGDIDQKVAERSFEKFQDQSPHYDPSNMARDQQPLMSQPNHGDMDPRSVTPNDPHFYEHGNVPEAGHPQQFHMRQQLPYGGAGINQYEPRQHYGERQDPRMFQNPETAPYQQNISQHNAPIPFENPQQMPHPRFPQPGNPDNYSSYVTPRPQDTHEMQHQIRNAIPAAEDNYQMQGGQQQHNYNNPRMANPNYPPGNPEYASQLEPYQATGQIQTPGNPNYPPDTRPFPGAMTHMHDAAYGPTGQQPPIPRFPQNPNFSQPVGPNNIPYIPNAPDSYRADERAYRDEDYAHQPQNYPIGIHDDLQQQRLQLEPRIPPGPWACRFCTVENPSEVKICAVCAKSRDFNLDAPTSQMKECEICRKLNPIGEKTCQSCRRQIFDDHY